MALNNFEFGVKTLVFFSEIFIFIFLQTDYSYNGVPLLRFLYQSLLTSMSYFFTFKLLRFPSSVFLPPSQRFYAPHCPRARRPVVQLS